MQNNQIPVSASTRFYFQTPEGYHTHKESLAFLREAGFDGVDFALEAIPYLGLDEEGKKRYCYELADYAAKIGIRVEFGHLPFRGTVRVTKKTPEAITAKLHSDMLECIRAAGYLGLKRAVIHPIGDGQSKGSDEENETWYRANLEYLSSYLPDCEAAGIKLAIENMRNPGWREGFHRYGCTADEVLALARATGQEICWDFGHAHTSGLNQKTELGKLGDRLTVTHVNDNYAGEDEHLLPYFGTINWEDAIAGLRDAGFSHFLNLECKVFRVPSEAHMEAARYGVKITRYLAGRITGQEIWTPSGRNPEPRN